MRAGVRFCASSSPRLPKPPVVAKSSTVVSSAAITAPSSSTAIFCGRNSISAARASIGSASLAEDVAQQDLRELLHEQRRHVDAVAAEQPHVRRFERARRDQPLAEAQPDRRSSRARRRRRSPRAPPSATARRGSRQQRVVQRELGGARFAAPARARAA